MTVQHLLDEQLSAQLDGALGPEELSAVETHLQTCAHCAGRRDLLRATSHAVASLPPEEMPHPLDLAFLRQDRLPATVAPAGLAARVLRGRHPAWLPTTLAAAAVLVLAVSVGPRFVAPGGGGSSSTAGLAGRQAAPPSVSGSNQGAQPSIVAPGGGADLNSSIEGRANGLEAQKTTTGPDGSTLTILARPPGAPLGRPVELVVKLVGGPLGTTLGPRGMELLVARGPVQVSLAASRGASAGIRAADELDLSATWAAGTLSARPSPGAYTLIGRVMLSDGRIMELRLPFVVST